MKPTCQQLPIIALFSLISIGCAATQHLRPLPQGAQDVSLSLGGPLITQGITFPLPYTVLATGWGVHERLTLQAEIHPTAALYKTLALGAGVLWGVSESQGAMPAFSLNGRLTGATDFETAVLFPMLSLIASYPFAQEQWDVYGGLDALFQFHSGASALPRSLAPLLGVRHTPRHKLHYGAELKWLAATDEIEESTLDFPKPFGSDYGGLGFYLFAAMPLGGAKP